MPSEGRGPLAASIPGGAVWISFAGCTAAWLLYGAAFQWFVRAVIGHADGPWSRYLAAYVFSYLVGYLAIFAPGGVGVREVSLSSTLVALHLATGAEAALISVTSRLWLTVLEIVPGIAFVLRRRFR